MFLLAMDVDFAKRPRNFKFTTSVTHIFVVVVEIFNMG